MDDIVNTYEKTGAELSPDTIMLILIVGAILVVLALVITTIFRIEKIVKENEKKLQHISNQLEHISRQNTSSGSSSTWENNNHC